MVWGVILGGNGKFLYFREDFISPYVINDTAEVIEEETRNEKMARKKKKVMAEGKLQPKENMR